MLKRSILTEKLKQLWAAHCYIHLTKDISEIAKVINVSTTRLKQWMQSEEWEQALTFWGHPSKLIKPRSSPLYGDLKLAEQVWTDLIKRGELNGNNLQNHKYLKR